MKPDAELNQLVATALMHWKIEGSYYINSQKEKKYTLDEYRPLSDDSQFKELAAKMQARDYNLTIKEPDGSTDLYQVEFTKYGESFAHSDKSLTRAGTVAALKAYNQEL